MIKRMIIFVLTLFCIINIHAMTTEQKTEDQTFDDIYIAEKKLLDVYFACVVDKDGKLAHQHVQDFKILAPSTQNRKVVMPLFVQAMYDEFIHVLRVLFEVFPDVKDMTNNDGLTLGHYAAASKNQDICDLCTQYEIDMDETDAQFEQDVIRAAEKVLLHAKSEQWSRDCVKTALKNAMLLEMYDDLGLDAEVDALRQWMKKHGQIIKPVV